MSPTGSLAPSRLRVTTPSPEKCMRRRTARIQESPLSTGSPRKKLFSSPGQAASPGERFEFSKSSLPDVIKAISSSQRIEFEQFKLVENGKARVPTEEEHELILKAFPSALSVGVYFPMVVVCFQKLPSNPRPLSVAGLPVTFTTDEHSVGLDYGILGGSRMRALEDHDARENVTENTLDAAIQYFENELLISISEIVNLSGAWTITVPNETTIESLPRFVAQAPCFYKHVSEVQHIKEAAFRDTEPNNTVWDQSKYEILQPGLMLGSGGAHNELLTTSGIVVKDRYGYEYLTLGSHGFPLGREIVYHPNANGITVGEVHDRITDTDIALLRLAPSQRFSNITFGARLCDGTTISPQHIQGIKNPYQMRRFDTITMNSPFTGYCEGLYMGTGKLRVPADDPVVLHNWVTTSWTYFGNGRDEPMEGCCGSPLLDEDGFVVSFFRFLNRSGLGVGIAATTLETWGYTVA
ncbi:hypothetical protein MMC22_000595 [Lobaria immixta]|nr:hypothetical protein [Lobaria immixta]